MGADCYMPLGPRAAGGDAPGNPSLSLNPARIGPAVRAGCIKSVSLVYICRASLVAYAWCPPYPLRLEAPTGLPVGGDGGGYGNGEGHGGMGRMRRRTGRSGAEAQRRSWPLMHTQWRARRSWRRGPPPEHKRAQRVQRAQMSTHCTEATEGTEDTRGHRGQEGHTGCGGYRWHRGTTGTQGTEDT